MPAPSQCRLNKHGAPQAMLSSTLRFCSLPVENAVVQPGDLCLSNPLLIFKHRTPETVLKPQLITLFMLNIHISPSLLGLLTLIGGLISFSALAQEPSTERPNIILIVAESHRAEALGAANHPFLQTPHLDELARAGTHFENAYVSSAICVVSRASILTGQQAARHGINDFADRFSAADFQKTFPLRLKAAGYQLAWLGWFGIGSPPSTDAFDLWQPDIPWIQDDLHHTDQITERASNWLANQDGQQPFFMQINYSAAHEIDPTENQPAQFLVQQRHQQLFADINIANPLSADPAVWQSFPDFFRTDDNIARARWHGFFDSPELLQQSTKDYYRLIAGLDEAVGKLRQSLSELGLAENTIIIYTSDHGFSLGEHGLMGKWYPFEQNIRVPLLIHHPSDPNFAHSVRKDIALNIDLAPTLLDLAGLPIPSDMQGQSLRNLPINETDRRTHFYYQHATLGSPLLPQTEAIVTPQLKYIYFPEHDYEMLYDLSKDPAELHNVVEEPDYQKQLDQLRAQLTNDRRAAR